VNSMAEDLGRYLRHEPIRARPDALAYRAAKFLRRYWLPVSAAALVIASLSAGLYTASHERAIAERRFSQLRQLSNKIFDLDEDIRDLPFNPGPATSGFGCSGIPGWLAPAALAIWT